MRIVVDLPAPFGPRKPVTRPGSTVKEMSSTAALAPYVLVRPCATIMRSTRARSVGKSWDRPCRPGACGNIGERPDPTLNRPRLHDSGEMNCPTCPAPSGAWRMAVRVRLDVTDVQAGMLLPAGSLGT